MARLLLVQPLFVEQFGVMILAAAARAKGHAVAVAIGSDSDIVARARTFKPDVVGFSVMTGYQTRYLALGKRLKAECSPPPLILFGGPHPTFFPEVVLQDGVDLACQGEGEGLLVELLAAIETGAPVAEIPNLISNDGGSMFVAPMRPLAVLDELPFPDREIYRDHPMVDRSRTATFMASRGCPFHCSFCFNHKTIEATHGSGSWVRFRSAESLVREIQSVLKTRNVSLIDFQDDTFALRREWVLHFLTVYEMEIGLPFHCLVRADTITREMAGRLKQAGCAKVTFGLECGDETLRNDVLETRITNAQLRRAADVLDAAGIPFITTGMMGLPGETLQQALRTLDMNVELGAHSASVGLLRPSPGTRLADHCVEHGYLDGPISVDRPVDVHATSPLNQPDIQEVVNLQKFAYVAIRFAGTRPMIRRLVRHHHPVAYLYVHRVSYLLLYFRKFHQTSWWETATHGWAAWRYYR